jgi:hypothetical protein
MPFTQSDLDALDTAFKTGTASVRYEDGSEVTWRSVDEYFRLRALIIDGIAAASSSPGVRCTLASFSKD